MAPEQTLQHCLHIADQTLQHRTCAMMSVTGFIELLQGDVFTRKFIGAMSSRTACTWTAPASERQLCIGA